MNNDLARELRGFVQLMKLGGNRDLNDGQGASDALYEAAIAADVEPKVAAGHAHNINNAMIALQGTVDASLSRLDIAAKSLDSPDKLVVCPDGCWRPKARNADDCAAGCCSKWYAVRDPEADAECYKLAAFWKLAPTVTGMLKEAEGLANSWQKQAPVTSDWSNGYNGGLHDAGNMLRIMVERWREGRATDV